MITAGENVIVTLRPEADFPWGQERSAGQSMHRVRLSKVCCVPGIVLYTQFKGYESILVEKFSPSYSVPLPGGNQCLVFLAYPSKNMICLYKCSGG